MSSANTEGDATLVLLTPVALGAKSWGEAALSPSAEYRYEYPGHGSREPRDGWDLDWLADDVASRVHGPLNLVGISMGSMVAQHLMIRHPARVRSALLMAAGAATNPEIMNERAERVLVRHAEGVVDETLERWFSAEALADPMNQAVAATSATLRSADEASVATAWRAMGRHDVRDALPSVEIATTCVAASEDRATPLPAVEELERLIPTARFELVPGPHMTHLESPARFEDLLTRHFDRIGVPG